jgi:hypothetical protein
MAIRLMALGGAMVVAVPVSIIMAICGASVHALMIVLLLIAIAGIVAGYLATSPRK